MLEIFKNIQKVSNTTKLHKHKHKYNTDTESKAYLPKGVTQSALSLRISCNYIRKFISAASLTKAKP